MPEQKETASVSLSKGVLIAIVSLTGGGAATGALMGAAKPHEPAVAAVVSPDALARIEAKIDANAKATADLRAEVAEIRGELKARP